MAFSINRLCDILEHVYPMDASDEASRSSAATFGVDPKAQKLAFRAFKIRTETERSSSSTHPRTSLSPCSLLPLYIGAPIAMEYVSSYRPDDLFSVGEFVGLTDDLGVQCTLTFITKVGEDGSLEHTDLEPNSTKAEPRTHFRKLKSPFLMAVMSYLIMMEHVSLHRGPFTTWPQGEEAPKFDGLVSRDYLRSMQPGESCAIGELVAIRDCMDDMRCTRVIRYREGSAACIPIDSCPELAGTIWYPWQKIKKMKGYPGLVIPSSPLLMHKRPSPQGTSLMAQLITEFMKRPVQCVTLSEGASTAPIVYGFISSIEERKKDHKRLVEIMGAHNTQFQERIQGVFQREDCFGSVEELHLQNDTQLYIASDFHGSAISLLVMLQELQAAGFLDRNYVCAPRFSLAFLGDYLDRGSNDIILLSLLLAFRMINPSSVFELRGNHEAVSDPVHTSFSDRSMADFLRLHPAESAACFKSFPLALYVASQEPALIGQERRQFQYVHLSHGLFSLSVDPSSIVRGQNAIIPVFSTSNFASSWTSEAKRRRDAGHILVERFQNRPEVSLPQGFLWHDIQDQYPALSTPPRERCSNRNVFSPQDIQLFRQASETDRVKICFFLRGHQHAFKEHRVMRKKIREGKNAIKVIATTLPLNCISPLIEGGLVALVVKVASRVRDWKKSSYAMKVHADKCRMELFPMAEEKGMYEPLCG